MDDIHELHNWIQDIKMELWFDNLSEEEQIERRHRIIKLERIKFRMQQLRDKVNRERRYDLWC